MPILVAMLALSLLAVPTAVWAHCDSEDQDFVVGMEELYLDEPAVAEMYLARACEAGCHEACWYAALAASRSAGPQSFEAIRFVKMACAMSGNELWCKTAELVEPSLIPRFKLYNEESLARSINVEACRNGKADACYQLGRGFTDAHPFFGGRFSTEFVCSLSPFEEENECELFASGYYLGALQFYRHECRKGSLRACYRILDIFQKGIGDEDDANQAEKQLRELCKTERDHCACGDVVVSGDAMMTVEARKLVREHLGFKKVLDHALPFVSPDGVQYIAAVWYDRVWFGRMTPYVGVFGVQESTLKTLWESKKKEMFAIRLLAVRDVDSDGEFEVITDCWDGGSGATYHRTSVYKPSANSLFVQKYYWSGDLSGTHWERKYRSASLRNPQFTRIREWFDENFELEGGLVSEEVCSYYWYDGTIR